MSYHVCSSLDAAVAEEGSVGEISLQVDLFTHPNTGEHKITVKGKFLYYRSYPISYTDFITVKPNGCKVNIPKRLLSKYCFLP